MNGVKVGAGYGSLIAGVLMVVVQHFGVPIPKEMVDYLSGVLVMIGGGLLHLGDSPSKK